MYAEEGYPLKAQVGVDGLEEIFERQLTGKLGGELLAGDRVLARAKPGHGATVRTTIDPSLEQDAIDALGANYGGITVMNPHTGAIEAAAGIAFTALQPPGSTFKIVTATGALSAGITTPSTDLPVRVEHRARRFQDAERRRRGLRRHPDECVRELMRHDFRAAGCKARRRPAGQHGQASSASTRRRGSSSALESRIPSAGTIGGPLSVGASAIGQGVVQASTLEMADVAATIADGGRRPLPTMLYGARPRFVRVTTPKVAGEVQGMMEAVVNYGTGTPAQIPGVTVAGKTGTAELKNTAGKKNDAKDTDAWFVGYAPVGDPKVVVCALFPNQGYGADTAAPAVKSVIEAALGITS